MTTTKCLGICMDHANANLIEFADGPLETNIIQSKFTHAVIRTHCIMFFRCSGQN